MMKWVEEKPPTPEGELFGEYDEMGRVGKPPTPEGELFGEYDEMGEWKSPRPLKGSYLESMMKWVEWEMKIRHWIDDLIQRQNVEKDHCWYAVQGSR
jgi:hypothetical protein